MEALTVIVILVILALPLLIALRWWIRGSSFNEVVDGDGLVAVVTGANSGIGKELTRELAKRKVKVYMLCRNLDRATKAREDLMRKYTIDPEKLVILLGDLTKFDTIRQFVEGLKTQEQKVDILVNNAGILLNKEGLKTDDGFELVWQSNYLGHVLLTKMLMPLLEASADGGRVVNVSSWVHNIPEIGTVLSTDEEFFSGINPDLRSKLAQVMHAVALTICQSKCNPGSKVTINSCNPGKVAANIFPYPSYLQWLRSLPRLSPRLYPREWKTFFGQILKTAKRWGPNSIVRCSQSNNRWCQCECKEEESRQNSQPNFELNSLRLLHESLQGLQNLLVEEGLSWDDLECIRDEITQRTTAKEQEDVNDLQGTVNNGEQEVLGQPSTSIKMPFDAIDT